ncbi:MAG: Gfo/Idh/MocA family oxidoreductase [Bacteroidota bacterium]
MSEQKKYNWGILAPGGIAQKFADDLQFVPNARVHAVASRSLERAEAFAQKYGAQHAFGSYEELVNCPDLDVIYIATPHSEHYANTLMCLNAGIPVLCEKAFAVNSKQLTEMVALARSKKIFLQEAIWTRFHPSIAKVMAILAAGTIGKIVHIAADFGFMAGSDLNHRIFNPNLTGGSLMDIGIYPLFISKLLLGNPETIKAVAVKAVTGVDMNCSMALNYTSGATASLFSTVGAVTDTTCTIYGDKGKILIHGRFHETKGITVFEEGQEPQFIECERLGHGYSYEAEDVQRCLAEGLTENNKLPLSFSLELMAILDEVRHQIGVVYPEEM